MSKRVIMLLISIQLIFLIDLVKSYEEKKFNFTLFTEDDSHSHDKLRTSYTRISKGGIYTRPYSDNNLTGTGFQLKDVAYRALCETLSCSTACCEGLIQVIACGIPENCLKYQSFLNTQNVISTVIGCVIGGLALIYFMAHCCKDGSHKHRSGHAFLIILSIVCLPITLFYCLCLCCKNKNNGNNPQDVQKYF